MSIKASLQHYFERNPNEKIYLKDLANSLELPEKSIQNSVTGMIREGYELEVVVRGQCWIYKPTNNGLVGEQKVKVVGETSKGSLIIEVDDVLWIARKFEE